MTQETQNMTAVQWLALRYHHRQGYVSQDDIAEAKAMEKEQIVNAYEKGAEESWDSEQYYNKTYNI